MGLHLPSHSRQAQPFYKEGAEATAPAPSGDIDAIRLFLLRHKSAGQPVTQGLVIEFQTEHSHHDAAYIDHDDHWPCIRKAVQAAADKPCIEEVHEWIMHHIEGE